MIAGGGRALHVSTHAAAASKNNNFGALRLIFASLVIVSHSPELVDGNRSRELLTRIFHTLSFGEVSVYGFFLISGYLIAKSFAGRPSTKIYLVRRFARFVPGYFVCFTICLLVIGPFVGATEAPLSISIAENFISHVLRLLPPFAPGAFSDLPYPFLNGSMWTIAYEFRCYLVVALIGTAGAFVPFRRGILICAVVAGFVSDCSGVVHDYQMPGQGTLGTLECNVRFGSVFGVGTLFYLFKDRIRLNAWAACGCLIALSILMFSRTFATAAFACLGGYLIMWIAQCCRAVPVRVRGDDVDISYGLYLYAWPIQNLIIWSNRTVEPWKLCACTLAVASAIGYVSWSFVERPAMRFARRWAAGGPSSTNG